MGTTYSCVGLYTEEGKVKILEDEEGKKTQPSVITFLDDCRTAVGYDAYKAAKEDPSRTLVYDVKRLIGKFPDHEEVKTGRPTWPFDITGDDHNRIRIKRNEAPQSLAYSEEMSAIVLEKMKAMAEKEAHSEIRQAVVTVPAYFTKSQK